MDNNENQVYTIKEFCDLHKMTPATFHKLKREGKAPKQIQFHSKVIITHKAMLEWREAMENKQL